MGIILVGGSSGALQEVDATPLAARGILYDSLGNVLAKKDRASLGIVPGTTAGLPLIGASYRTPVILRATDDGALITSDRNLLLYDRGEGAAVDTNKWIQTTTTMTIAQGTGVITFNSGNSVAINVGAMHTSHRFIPFMTRVTALAKFRARHTAHQAGNIIEHGFGSPASAITASAGNGAFWRKNASGDYIPVISINGTETQGTTVTQATFVASVAATDYAIFEVLVQNNHARFTIFKTTGEVVNMQTVDVPPASTSFQATHLQVFARTWNSAALGGTVQLLLDDVSVWVNDHTQNKPWPHIQAGMSYAAPTSPTAYTQNANYANSAAPASATLSNTAAGYTTLGGQWQFVAVAGAETDYALFGFQVPSPYAFTFTGIRIAAINTVVAVATTATVLQWGMAFNSSAVSLATAAPYTPMRVTIGVQAFPIAAAVGAVAADLIWTPPSPVVVQPGRFIHVILKMPVATATATEVFRGVCAIDGYFE
jgi:hypothetical protein